MLENKLKGLIALGSLITIIGFILLFYSVNFGLTLAEKWIAKQGGAATSTYEIVIKGFTNNFLVAGSILFGSGLVTIIFAYYKIINLNK